MIDIFSPLGDAPPVPVIQNWTGLPEPPFWKELTGGMSWPPSGAFPPSPPPACAYSPTWPCKPWPPSPPPGWPSNWPWPLPLGPAAGVPPPTPPGAAAPPPTPTKPEGKQKPWGWIILGGLALGAGLLVMSGAGVLALADNPRERL